MDGQEQSINTWSGSQVSSWLKSIGIKTEYVEKLAEEEVDGKVLVTLNEDFLLTNIHMKLGPAHLIIQRRNELIDMQRKSQKKKRSSKQRSIPGQSASPPTPSEHPLDEDVPQCTATSRDDCKPRPFDTDAIDFIYVKNRVLQPESGAFDLISPCHEFKSLAKAATLDRTRLQAKFAYEVLKFATGCMNIRTNGTIHFGVMDSKEDKGYVHGEIIGIPVTEKDMYVDALDYIDRCSSDKDHFHQCVRPPRFIEVMDRDGTEKRYVVEVDIVPSLCVVKSKVYKVRLPNFNDDANKVQLEKQVIYRRLGAKSEPVGETDVGDFYQRVKDRDTQREEAEKRQFFSAPHMCPDLGRKLTMLMTRGKKFIEKDKWFIIVTNKFQPEDLCSIDWLLNLNTFCVFDFDPDSKVSGLCSRYLQHHAANMHFLQDYGMPAEKTVKEFIGHLRLFDQTSWIFCNGRSNFDGNESSCDEMTWMRTKLTLLKEAVSLICKQILPKGTFQVLFLLTSPIEKPLLHIFYEFFTDMQGHEDIICICQSEEDFLKWQAFVEGSFGLQTVTDSSVVGMKMSHINSTLQRVQPVKAHIKHLPVFVKGTCLLATQEEERMCSLEILTVDHCDETSQEFIDEEKDNIEGQFYHGGRVTWLNLWLAEQNHVGEVIERDAYKEVCKLLNEALTCSAGPPVHSINVYHHPGSGGSTVARQVLWNKRKEIRCAVVKPSNPVSTVAKHAVELREYEEKDPEKTLPVLLLIEDLDKEYVDDLKNELEEANNVRGTQSGTPCFILLSCRRSHDPDKKCTESPLQNVSVTHKLSALERRKFSGKRQVLEEQYGPQFILTFVLMSEGFSEDYVHKFVEHLLHDIDRQSQVTRLILYVALLNTYVPNSFVSQSHCEAFLSLSIYMERFRQQAFEQALTDQAKLVFLHLKDDRTHIESIRIIHPLVAKEILLQLLDDHQTQSSLAMDLLKENVLFEHRFAKDDYLSSLKALFIRRSRISKGDDCDSFFSPLVEHVCNNEKRSDRAIEMLTEAFQRFRKDPFIAQQLARLHYTFEHFVEAKSWAETAVKELPKNSYILDTLGQVHKKWFHAKCRAIEAQAKTAENTADAVDTALTALKCFQDSERAAIAEMENMNSSGYFAEVEVGCDLLKLISSLQVFSKDHAEYLNYLLTDYIPVEVEKAWEPFHGKLKNLHKTMRNALEWISEDLSFFQTDSGAEDGTHESPEVKIRQPLAWLAKKSAEYGKYLSEPAQGNSTALQKYLIIHRLGGGNVTSILSKLTDQKDAVPLLKNILHLYPSDPLKANLHQRDIVNYIMTHITLNCLSPQPNAPTLEHLQALCRKFPADKRKCLPSSLFLLTLLFWPEDQDSDRQKETKYEIVQSAFEDMEKGYWSKMKDIPQRKRRIYTHFFLGSGNGLDRFIHKRKLDSITNYPVLEKRLKWFSGEAWQKPGIAQMLKSVSGWTEHGKVYLTGPKKKFSVQPLHVPSVPNGNENITFYLGFTFRGPVACNINVTSA